jgi:alpha-N-acetylglucosaminidase
MKTTSILTCLLATAALFISCSGSNKSDGVLAAEALAKRLIPEHAARIEFREVPADSSDTFTLSSEKGRIVIEANNAGTMAVGLNYYLNNYCNTTVSEYAAHHVEMPEVCRMCRNRSA